MRETRERRRCQRLSVNLKAERLSCINDCSVFIENLSETGIHMITAPARNPALFETGRPVELKLKTTDGDILRLQCNVKWSFDNTQEDLTNSVGLEIIDPPTVYLDFLKTLD